MPVIADELNRAQAASALAWWLEMGVDVAVQEAPRDWLRPAAEKAPASAVEAAVSNLARPSHETLAELQGWLASSTELPLASATALADHADRPGRSADYVAQRRADTRGSGRGPADRRRAVGAGDKDAGGHRNQGGRCLCGVAVVLPHAWAAA